MIEVAQWIVENTPFDRLYFYGDNRPLHVSCEPEDKREIVLMKDNGKGLLVPKVMKAETLGALSSHRRNITPPVAPRP
jgi:hypothetical protein